jgi:chromosome segregation ATPase
MMRRKLPELLLEAAMIFFAVMLALAAEEWREKNDRLELADRALQSVVEEMRSNLDELETTGVHNTERLESANAVLAELEAGRDQGGADVGLEVALLSSAAWQSAQMSQAVQYLDFDVMRELSEVYEVQDLYERVQSSAVDHMTAAMRTAQDDPAAAVRQGVISLALLADLRTSLAEVYGAALEEIEADGGAK